MIDRIGMSRGRPRHRGGGGLLGRAPLTGAGCPLVRRFHHGHRFFGRKSGHGSVRHPGIALRATPAPHAPRRFHDPPGRRAHLSIRHTAQADLTEDDSP
jgi:hypothetical protein